MTRSGHWQLLATAAWNAWLRKFRPWWHDYCVPRFARSGDGARVLFLQRASALSALASHIHMAMEPANRLAPTARTPDP